MVLEIEFDVRSVLLDNLENLDGLGGDLVGIPSASSFNSQELLYSMQRVLLAEAPSDANRLMVSSSMYGTPVGSFVDICGCDIFANLPLVPRSLLQKRRC